MSNVYRRTSFLDFSPKAFDCIGHHVLITWTISLSSHVEDSKINTTSQFRMDFSPVKQEFLREQKRTPASPDTRMWKYVMTFQPRLLNRPSIISVYEWASNNWMKLNFKKCKELRICFLRNIPNYYI